MTIRRLEEPEELAESTAATAELDRTWLSPPGFLNWFTHVNARVIGPRFIITAFIFFLLAGIFALLLRIQLAYPQMQFLSPELYNQLFTMHGTVMMFFFAIPVMEGFAIFLVPLMVGSRDMAFPRLTAFGYYIFLIGGITLFTALILGSAPNAGWFNYVPLSGRAHSPGYGVDVWTTMITFLEVAALTAAVEIIVTILKMRAPGMSLNRMPLFVWAALVTAFMIVFAMPAVIVSSTLLILDRLVDTQFFVPETGGQPLLWQHLFWFFGHPEVYIILVPALGMISTIIITFTRRPIFGYTALVLSLVAVGFISFGLWVHHMFTTGLPQLGMSFFTAASVMIAIPSGVQVFCWIASLWGARIRFQTPMLWVLGFFAIFVIGGLTGVMIASIPFDKQVHDTYFLVAHLHYVLIGGAVFPLIGATYYWWPKITGRLMSETAGKWSFWLAFIGFNVAFFPMHQLGLEGMPRRVYTYLEESGWQDLNLLSTSGAFVLAGGFAITLANVIWSLVKGPAAGNDPWGAPTLEWATDSPPPNYNHRHIPVIDGRHPLWDWRERGERHVVTGLREDRREVLVTTILDAEPQTVQVLPGPTPWPFIAALAAATAFIGIMFHPIFFVIGFFLAFFAIAAWLWPRRPWRND